MAGLLDLFGFGGGFTPGYNPNAPSPGLLSGVAGQGGQGGGWQDKLQGGIDHPFTQIGLGLLSQGDLGKGIAAGAQGIQQTGDRKLRRGLLGLQTQQLQAGQMDAARKRAQAQAYRSSLPPDSPLAALPDEQLLSAAATMATRETPEDAAAKARAVRETPEEAAARARVIAEGTFDLNKQLREAGRPSTTVNVDTKGQAEGAKVMYESGAKAFDSAVTGARQAARNLPIYDRLDQAMNTFKTGATAEIRLKAAQVFSDLGVPIDPNNLSEGEIAKSTSRILELAAAPKGQGQITENERKIIREQIPQIGNTVEGNRKIIGMLRRLDEFDGKVADIYIANAEKNNGIVNYVEAAKEIRKLGTPLTTADESFLSSAGRRAPAGAPGAPAVSRQPQRYNYVPGKGLVPE